ncbi:LOW QUALITY PROTEIN: hypothetical protein SETIT_2G005700v2 [Setaria italica]|uniref:Band 7 domain-containing protein n=1 Tax=Setaria italica TaxID=4555 RepID=A0A368PU36_SETIT|nr:LOW QUALITY PROTEIN: hypothetical protein SETIT_2G005700v2 [Setaria italica]
MVSARVLRVLRASVAVVEKWGRFVRLAEPGLHFFNPFAGECVAGSLTTRVQSLDDRVETKTKYRVVKENADDAFYELQNPQQQIQAYVFDVPRMNLDDLFEQKNDVAKAVLEELEKVMADYGYSIEHILMVDIIPDAAASAGKRLQGEAEKILLVKKAEAEAEAKYLSGVGIAKQRQAITDGLRENILNFSHSVSGTSAKEVMDLIMVTQYFDTIKELGDGSKNTMFIPHGPGHVKDISEQIRDGMMQAASSSNV